MKKKPIIEACVCSLSESKAAEKAGADQIELCSQLELDGLTPKANMISEAIKALKIPVKVMLRPRDGDFIYTLQDKALRNYQLERIKKLKVRHWVYGSTKNQRLDIEDITEVFNLIIAGGYPIDSLTIHKAIDHSKDILGDLQLLLDSYLYQKMQSNSCQLSILSSGGAATAKEGAQNLQQMIRLVGASIQIIAAGKITYENLDYHHTILEAEAYHGRKIIEF